MSWLLLRQATLRTLAGVTGGLVAAWWLARWLQSLLFDVRPHDPMTFAGAALVASARLLIVRYPGIFGDEPGRLSMAIFHCPISAKPILSKNSTLFLGEPQTRIAVARGGGEYRTHF
jgi:hypothetical protein